MKKFLLIFILSVVGFAVARADEHVRGIIATYDGAEVSYKLADMPTVKYETKDGVRYAVFYMKNVAQPVLSVALTEGKQLVIAYGEYVPNTIESIESEKAVVTERNGRKSIQGGKLIVIGKDGKKYNVAGVEL